MMNRYVRLVVAATIAVVASALLQGAGLVSTSRDVHACAGPETTHDWCSPGINGSS